MPKCKICRLRRRSTQTGQDSQHKDQLSLASEQSARGDWARDRNLIFMIIVPNSLHVVDEADDSNTLAVVVTRGE